MALNDESQKQEVLKGNLFYQNSKPTLKSIQPEETGIFQMPLVFFFHVQFLNTDL